MRAKWIMALFLTILLLTACSSAPNSNQTQPPVSPPTEAQSAYVPPAGNPYPAATQPAYVPPAGNPYPAETQPAASQPAQVSVNISGFKFDPASITVKAGTTVTWTNQDAAAHTIVADDGSWASDSIKQGGTYSYTFDQAGTFSYKCGVHPSMVGTVEVQP